MQRSERGAADETKAQLRENIEENGYRLANYSADTLLAKLDVGQEIPP